MPARGRRARTTCPHCRQPDRPANDQFCMHCGVQLVANVRRCHKCGAYPDAADRYCIFCGEDLEPARDLVSRHRLDDRRRPRWPNRHRSSIFIGIMTVHVILALVFGGWFLVSWSAARSGLVLGPAKCSRPPAPPQERPSAAARGCSQPPPAP